MTESDEERAGEPLRPRGRHAAPASPVGARVTALAGPALAFAAARFDAFRAGPVLPWMSRHRLVLLIGGASLVSVLALGGAVALIQGAGSVAIAETGQPGEGRSQPGDDATPDAEPITGGIRTPTPTPTPIPTPTPTPSPPPPPAEAPDPGGTTTAPEPVATPAPVEEERRDVAPGATNRPDKPKG